MYYVLTYRHPEMTCLTGLNEMGLGEPWFSGSFINLPEDTILEFKTDPNYPGSEMCAFYDDAYPVFRDDFISALEEAGITNLQKFQARILNSATGETFDNFKAVNILGLIACANMGDSKVLHTSDSGLIDTDFDGLAIDEEKADGAFFFRLAENVSAVIVHEKIRDHVKSAGIEGVRFIKPERWAG